MECHLYHQVFVAVGAFSSLADNETETCEVIRIYKDQIHLLKLRQSQSVPFK